MTEGKVPLAELCHWLSLDPAHGDVLGENGAYVLWRSSRTPRDGLAFAMNGCDNPDCTCTLLKLWGVQVDDELSHVRATESTFEVTSSREHETRARPRLETKLDVATGVLEGPNPEFPADLWRWLQGRIDGELLDSLHAQFLRGKGLDAGALEPDHDEIESMPSFLPYGSLYPHEREDCYASESVLYGVLDLYCVAPGCRCGEAILHWERVDEHEEAVRDPVIGAVHLDLARPKSNALACRFVPEREADRALLESLYRRYLERWHGTDRLGRRMGLVRDYFRRRPIAAQSKRPGRNDPCPCGSGRKFKRCCAREGDAPRG